MQSGHTPGFRAAELRENGADVDVVEEARVKGGEPRERRFEDL